MKYVVTSGAGFIGSHLVERLVQENHRVRVVDNLSSGNIKNLAKVLKEIDYSPSFEAHISFDGIFRLGASSSSQMHAW